MNNEVNKVLVLGASGFVGGRLIERLILEHNHVPKCLIRDYKKLPRLCRFPVEIVYGDILCPKEFKNSIKDCDVYVFSVHGKEDSALNWKVNTEGLENMLKLAVKNKIKHFIFLSTTAIYEEQYNHGEFDESDIPVCKKHDYAGGKLRGEHICNDYSQRYNLPVTILRPTIIYGPFSTGFTVYPAELIISRILKDYECFDGICNPVFIDDVVDVIIGSILNESAVNNTFIVSSGETLTWREFFNALSNIITGSALEKSSQIKDRIKSSPLFIFRKCLKILVYIAPDFTKSVYEYIQSKGSGNWGWIKGHDASSIRFNFYKKELIFKIDKLRAVLDYEPKYNFDKGFKITTEWLKHHRYIDQSNTKIN